MCSSEGWQSAQAKWTCVRGLLLVVLLDPRVPGAWFGCAGEEWKRSVVGGNSKYADETQI
jgi:hypothetical protein